jgi:hypothetical protein
MKLGLPLHHRAFDSVRGSRIPEGIKKHREAEVKWEWVHFPKEQQRPR